MCSDIYRTIMKTEALAFFQLGVHSSRCIKVVSCAAIQTCLGTVDYICTRNLKGACEPQWRSAGVVASQGIINVHGDLDVYVYQPWEISCSCQQHIPISVVKELDKEGSQRGDRHQCSRGTRLDHKCRLAIIETQKCGEKLHRFGASSTLQNAHHPKAVATEPIFPVYGFLLNCLYLPLKSSLESV